MGGRQSDAPVEAVKAVDLFAGIGGLSEGARQAGVQTIWAANHWPTAVEWYERNHGLQPSCQDLQQANFHDVPDHDVLLAAPACQGHTHARGRERPHHDALRSTAWAVVACAEARKPAIVVVENVVEFLDWTLYPAWESAMRRLGYAVAPHVLDAADHGVPQHRVRLFIVCTRSRAPLQLQLPQRPHVPVASVIDWTGGRWSAIDRPRRSPATLRRCKAGRAAHGDRFVAPFYGSGSGQTGRSVHRPLGTITTKPRWLVVDGDRCRMLSVQESRAVMGMRADLQLPAAVEPAMKLLGNAVCPPVARDVLTAIRSQA